MQFLYQYPDAHGLASDMLRAGRVVDVATAAERAGWAGISFTEHPAPSRPWLANGGHQTLDPFVALATAAAVTSRLRLVTFLAVAPYRNPMLLAKSAASLDKVSNGRLTLGLGAGYLKSEFHALGVDFDRRNVMFDETLDVLPLHWSGQPFSYKGIGFEARDVIARPCPVQDPIPIWVGGNSRAAMRRVAQRCSGWMPMVGAPERSAAARTSTIASFEELARRISELKLMAGERASDLDVAVVYPEAGPWTDRDVDRHRDSFGHLRAAGVTWIVVNTPSGDGAATLEFLAGFGDAYLSRGD